MALIRSKVCFFLIILLLTNTVLARSSVWIAEKEGNTIILAGSIHLIHPSQLPLPPEYLKAYASSERIVFEIDLREMNNTVSMVKMLNTFRLKKGETLDKKLKPAVWQALKKTMVQYNVSPALLAYDAAFMSFSLPLIVWQQQGYGEGIDRLLYDKAITDKKEIIGLETFNEQLTALASLKEIESNTIIKETLYDLNDPLFSLENTVKEVYQGRQSVLDQQIAIYNTTEMEPFYQTLLIRRNKAWLPKIDRLAKDHKPTLVLVGAMHLVGDEGVLKLLETQGYKISYYE